MGVDKIWDLLSHSKLLKVALITLRPSGDQGDEVGWLEVGKQLTVSSTYDL